MYTKSELGHAAFDVVCLILVGLMFVLLLLLGHPVERGFFCGDQTINYPFRGNTISEVALTAVGAVTVVGFVLTLELLQFKLARRRGYTVRHSTLRSILAPCYTTIGIYLFGCASAMSLVQLSKVAVGRLRPHFLAVCRPDMLDVNCTKLVTEYDCENENAGEVEEARMSFMSGHAAFAFYCNAYICVYLFTRFPNTGRRPGLVVPVVQLLSAMVCSWVGYTRISDNAHHWSDVAAAGLLGTVIGLVCGYWMYVKMQRVPLEELHETGAGGRSNAIRGVMDNELYIAPNDGVGYRP